MGVEHLVIYIYSVLSVFKTKLLFDSSFFNPFNPFVTQRLESSRVLVYKSPLYKTFDKMFILII